MANRFIDARGRACPIPLVELMSSMREVRGGERVEVLADDRVFPALVAEWCKRSGHRILKMEARDSGVHAALIEKAP